MTLRCTHDVVSTIAEASGLDDLALNAEGVFELIVADRLSVYFRFEGEEVLELSVEVPALRKTNDPAVLREMLAVNATSPNGRLGMEPGTGRVFFGRRLMIADLTRATLLNRVDDFIRAAAVWTDNAPMNAAEALLARAAQDVPFTDHAVLQDTMLRA
ncbi:type III secretion system chaperone [Celeribacter naphthalenivorans]|uniref:type III secretion system chaperone n=1 Tax=Celeribacter naphthalenivorans TaxID=1614694 RepID=UPI001CFB007B|nr:type III secretion system chaperone [Celeribacter naphthalenivorans]